RGFRNLTVDKLDRINLIAGENNVGKTALLEAIYLNCNANDPGLLLDIAGLRVFPGETRFMEDVVAWLFHDGDHSRPFELALDDGTDRHSLTVWLPDAATSREEFPKVEQLLAGSFRVDLWDVSSPRVVMRYTDSNQAESYSAGVKTKSGVASISAKLPWHVPCEFIGVGAPVPKHDLEHFGELEKEKRLDDVLPSLQILEPRLTRLALVPFAGQSVIHGDIGLSHLVPIPFMGEGMRSLLSIVLALATSPGGVVLIDEIENGLHWSVLPNVWRSLVSAARSADAQVFLTTHSWECIRAAHEVFSADACYDLRLHRLDRKNGEISVATFDREMIDASLVMGLEMR
ncbi:MAG TPA: ATP-binding protein, partial [Pirellulales bacterium]|nr:ATP-binding protein [Pirellulales bacterium]